MIELLASESASGFGVSQWLELGVVLSTLGAVLSTLALVFVTAGLWYATSLVHKDEINKMTDAASHANDNITEVALAEIDAHHHNVRRMARIRHAAKGKVAQ